MKDPSKTNQKLIVEISVLKKRIQNLEQLALDHKKAEETLRESEAKYRLAFESTSDGIFTIDRNGNISSITPSVERQLGYKVEEVINRPLQDLNILTSESLARAVSDVIQILSGVEVTDAVYEFIAKDGTRKIGEVTGTPIIQEGRILGVTAIVRDITERKKTEEALRESEKRLRDIMFNIADWVWEVDKNGVYTYSSQRGSDLFGKSRGDIIGKTPFDFMPPDEAKRVAAIFSEIVANKAPIKDLENWNIGKDGEKICLLTNGVPILDEEGNLKGYRGVDKDITKRKQTENALRSLSLTPRSPPGCCSGNYYGGRQQ